jgi:hypothetical protein
MSSWSSIFVAGFVEAREEVTRAREQEERESAPAHSPAKIAHRPLHATWRVTSPVGVPHAHWSRD